MIPRRTQIVLLVLILASTMLLVGVWSNATKPAVSRPTATEQTTEASSRAQALAVLRSWDEQRSTAYAVGDAEALAALYLPGSDSGANDRQVLRQYLDRGLRVHDMRTQILDLDITGHEEASWTLVVTDRLSGGVAVGPGVRLQLPRDEATTRQIELRRVGVRWLVAEAQQMQSEPRDQPDVGRSRAEESTSTTPVSRKP